MKSEIDKKGENPVRSVVYSNPDSTLKKSKEPNSSE
jgi:hypothetical protein